MSYDLVFFAANAVIAPVWAAMILVPRWSVTQKVVRSFAAPAILAVTYLVLVLTHVGVSKGGFFSLDSVMVLFESRPIVLTGWVHYLCVDLVAGSLIFRDGQRVGVSHWLLAPCLFLTLMWGPIGVLSYLV